jgi:hypothetical protein
VPFFNTEIAGAWLHWAIVRSAHRLQAFCCKFPNDLSA